ncbi:MAG: hypothetical protein ACFHWX_00555 [Bacteroidota bacterium]
MFSFIKRWRYIFYGLHALFLVFVSLFIQESYFLYKDEAKIIQAGKLTKEFFSPYEHNSERFLFINTSYDNQLVNVYDETGFLTIGNRPITDRKKLIDIFSVLQKRPDYEFIICDIFFEQPQDVDADLENVIEKLPHFLASRLLSDSLTPIYPVIEVPSAIASVQVINDELTKFKLSYGDNNYTIPLAHYLKKNNIRYDHRTLFPRMNGHSLIDPFFLDLRITNFDLLIKKSYPLINLGELLALGEEAIYDLTKNRIIVLGDFIHHDNIETYLGQISGPLVLTNAYLALEEGDMVITWYFLIYMFICFLLITMGIFNPNDPLEQLIRKLKLSVFLGNMTKGFFIILSLIAISFFSFIFFHLHVNILLISFYLYLIDYLVRHRFRKIKKSKVKY